MMLSLSTGLAAGGPSAPGLGLTLGRGGWSPLSLGGSLLAWWDTSHGITLSGNQVTAWADRKNGHAAQGVGSARPSWSATSFGGAPGLVFDGVDDVLSLSGQPFPGGSAGSEIWAVVQQDAQATDGAARFVVSYGGLVSNDRRALGRFPVGGVNRPNIQYGTGSANTTVTSTVVDISGRHLLRGRFTTSAGASVSVDGGTAVNTTGTDAPATATTRVSIGALTSLSSYWHGKIRDVVVTTPLTINEANKLQTFLMSRRAV